MTKHYSQKNNLISIMKEISKKTPRGILNGDTQVGHITWQMYLMRDYLKLDGTPLANASNDYSDLLKFAQDNNLITADTTDKSLFKYDTNTDVLTLPDYKNNDYNYLVRLRADNNSLIDLAGNTWTVNGASIVTDSTLDKEVLSMDANGYADTSTLSEDIGVNDDFTIYI